MSGEPQDVFVEPIVVDGGSKPGWKTTEFWLTIIAAVFAVIEGEVEFGVVAGSVYAAARAIVKAKGA